MNHIPILIIDLAFILVIAGIITIIFRSIKQPVVLGYLLAGLLVGPHTPYIPTVQDMHSVKVWAEIGIIFLLFSLGLEFSFKKLAQVGKVATITALFEVIFMLLLGYWVGRLFDWSRVDSLFLGGILSISSTTIIVRSFEELNLKAKKFVSVVFGVLIVEDIVAILLLVILSTISVAHVFSGYELLYSTARLGFFLILWFIIGIYIIPHVLRSIDHHLNNEALLVISLGLCLSMVLIAVYSGFSAALGAFVMGSIMAETNKGKQIEHLFSPVKDLFAAIFFVSVGMLIDPVSIYKNGDTILIITFITIFGKLFSSTLGALLAGESLKNSIFTGLSLAQIGEFSFIIATLGLTLNVTSEFLYPLAVAVSVITTFTTPISIRYSEYIYNSIEKRLSPSFLNALERYRQSVSQVNQSGAIPLYLKSISGILIINFVIIVAIALIIKSFILGFIQHHFEILNLSFYIALGLTLLCSAPFLWAILFALPNRAKEDLSNIINLNNIKIIFFAVRLVVFLILIYICIIQFSSSTAAIFLIVTATALLLITLGPYAQQFYRYFEYTFLMNLNLGEQNITTRQNLNSIASPWDATLIRVSLSHGSKYLNKRLVDLKIKENFASIIVLVERGKAAIYSPDRDFKLQHGDIIHILGNEDKLEQLRLQIEQPSDEVPIIDTSDFGLECIVIKDESSLSRKSIYECKFRESTLGVVVGVERNGNRILTPDSSFIIEKGDRVWIAGDRKKIKQLA